MSSSKTVNNLNIRKFPTLSSYKAATIDPDDLCLVLDGKPVVQVTTLPTASADYLDGVYQYIGINGEYKTDCFYRCYTNGVDYFWNPIAVQDPTTADWSTKRALYSGAVFDNVALSNIVFRTPIDTGSPSTSPIVNRLFYIDINEDSSGVTTTNHFCAEIYIGLGGTSYQNILHASGDFANLKAFLFENDYNSQYLGFKNPDGTDIFAAGLDKSFKMIVSYFGVDSVNDSLSFVNNFSGSVSETQIPDKQSGGSSYTAGTGIDITNDVISVTAPTLVNKAKFSDSSIQINPTATSGMSGSNAIAIGIGSKIGSGGVAIGNSISSNTGYLSTTVGNNISNTPGYGSINLGNSVTSTAGTMSVALSNQNPDYSVSTDTYILLNRDGTVPTARLTKVNTTATLAVADWSSSTQTVSVTGMTADGVVFVNPTPANQSAYTSAGILCTAQAAGSLTFTCDTVPSADITVTVVML